MTIILNNRAFSTAKLPANEIMALAIAIKAAKGPTS